MDKKKIVFITGTRADFSKIKSLMQKVQDSKNYELYIFATGMHLSSRFGLTIKEIEKCGFKNIYPFINHDRYYQSDHALSSTIDGFSKYIQEYNPDLIVVHGDRIEPLAGAVVGSLNNILVAHIEGGEVSGTIDDSLRHAISKLSHIHLVNDDEAKRRLIQLGEDSKSIFVIGSPDLDILNSSNVALSEVRRYYDIDFERYGIVMFHPVTTEYESMGEQSLNLVNALLKSNRKAVVIYPNNDLGFEAILKSYERLDSNFKMFPSIRFEYFIALLKNADFIIGNSSCILKEARFFNIPSILVGSRQRNRAGSESVVNVEADEKEILSALNNLKVVDSHISLTHSNSAEIFYELLESGVFFSIPKQKIFWDRT